jgi:Fur family zinc uptake transcriptional regulator
MQTTLSTMNKTTTNPAFLEHDHSRCAKEMIRSARLICSERGLRLTPVRMRVLEILTQSHVPLGAYEVLDQLATAGFRAQPPVAYRALDFLVSNGLAHRIEKLNAFVACANAESGHSPVFMICGLCRRVAETTTQTRRSVLDQAARELGFDIRQTTIELEGRCTQCQGGGG